MATVATQTPTRRELETRLIEKAWKDPIFRNEIIGDPKGMLEKHTGQKLPEQLRIYVHQEDANTLHFSIPLAPSNLNELSDEDLEKIAGGTDITVTICMMATGAAAMYAGMAAASAAVTAVATAGAVMGGTGAW